MSSASFVCSDVSRGRPMERLEETIRGRSFEVGADKGSKGTTVEKRWPAEWLLHCGRCTVEADCGAAAR